MVMVVVWFWLRILGLMLVSEIMGLVWYDHRQELFPHFTIICRELNKSCVFHVGVGKGHVLL